jgi:hypothetical protein
MRCAVCGMDYGLSHNCSGIAPLLTAEERAPPPAGFSPGYYLALAFNIARWDDVAVRQAADDPKALSYGILFWAVANYLPFAVKAAEFYGRGRSALGIQTLVGALILLPLAALLAIAQIGTCHLVAKWFCAADGRFVRLIRPLLLGSIVLVLAAIPYVGIIAASIAWIAIFCLVFQEIDNIEPLQAFLISAVIGICIRVMQGALFATF